MRRAIARGRVFPQSYSTDRRYGRLSLKACALFPLMWANADDQGRLCGDPEEVKYAVCLNIDHVNKADIFDVLCIPPLSRIKDVDIYPTLVNAVKYCTEKRAMLTIAPPLTWTSQLSAKRGVNSLRRALGSDYCSYAAAYFPRLKMTDYGKESLLEEFNNLSLEFLRS